MRGAEKGRRGEEEKEWVKGQRKRKSLETDMTTRAGKKMKLMGRRKGDDEVCGGAERERRRKKPKTRSSSWGDLASHPAAITAPHVRHCEDREEKKHNRTDSDGKKERNKVEK